MDEEHEALAAMVDATVGLASRHEPAMLERLLEPLNPEQLRTLAAALAGRLVDTATTGISSPMDVCHFAIEAAAKEFHTSPEAIASTDRTREVIDARAVAMTAVRANGLTLAAIGEHFGGRNHSTVLHALGRTGDHDRLSSAAQRIAESINARYQPEQGTRPVLRLIQNPGRIEPDRDPATVGLTPVQVAIHAAARRFHTTPEQICGPSFARGVADARAVAASASRMAGVTYTAIGVELNRDHTTVLGQVRRVDKIPPLREIADQIAHTLEVPVLTRRDPAPPEQAVTPETVGTGRATARIPGTPERAVTRSPLAGPQPAPAQPR